MIEVLPPVFQSLELLELDFIALFEKFPVPIYLDEPYSKAYRLSGTDFAVAVTVYNHGDIILRFGVGNAMYVSWNAGPRSVTFGCPGSAESPDVKFLLAQTYLQLTEAVLLRLYKKPEPTPEEHLQAQRRRHFMIHGS